MRKYLVLLWLLAPVGLIYFHYGPGQRLLAYDRAAEIIKNAETLELAANKDSSEENWQKVVQAYKQAQQLIGEEDSMIARRIKLSSANALMYQGELYESMSELKTLLSEAVENRLPADYTNQVRETLARCQFGAAWVMRLEGADTKDWTAQAEKARQNFRLLAEEALEKEGHKISPDLLNKIENTTNSANKPNTKNTSNKSDTETPDSDAIDHQKNLESTVRMEQLDASTIKGLPLPKEAQNGQGKGLSDKMQEGEGEGEGEGQEGIGELKEGDARGKGASNGQRWQGIGS